MRERVAVRREGRGRRVPSRVVALLLVAASAAAAQEATHEPSSADGTVAGESTFLDTPPLPGLDIMDALRFDVRSFAAPDAPLESGHVSLYRPELRARITVPLAERAVLRVAGQIETSRYTFRGAAGGATPYELGRKDLDLHRAQLSLEGSYRFDAFPPALVSTEEIWSCVGALFGNSRWEDGEFRSGLGTGAALGVGYALPGHLRVVVGLSLHNSRSEDGLNLGPLFSLRWYPSERLTLRTRELGLQIDYDLAPGLDLYATGFRTSDRFALSDRLGAPDDLRFSDRFVRVGAGVDWRVVRWLDFQMEVGGIAYRRIRVDNEDLGTLASARGDPSVYLDVRMELRP